MKNVDDWNSSSIIYDQTKGRWKPDLRFIYAGSVHAFSAQFKVYEPFFQKWCTGKLLDCGCGKVPYYGMLKDQVSFYYCIDHSENPLVSKHLDEIVDIGKPFQLKEREFDCILISDVIAHVSKPGELMKTLADHLRPDGTLVLTTPFVYWISEYPNEYFHPTEFALRDMCNEAGLQIIDIQSYGGYADVLLDTINKGMISTYANRVFRLLASVVKKMSWYKRKNEKTKYSYPLGYALVARKT